MERGPPSRSSPSHRNRRLHLVALLSPGLLCRDMNIDAQYQKLLIRKALENL